MALYVAGLVTCDPLAFETGVVLEDIVGRFFVTCLIFIERFW